LSLDLVMEYYITYLAITMRMVAFLLFVPVLGGRRVPVTVRVAIALVLALIVLPVAAGDPAVPTSTVELVVLMAREFLVGAILGFLVELVFMLARVFGRVADIELGFGIAQTIDPQYGSAPLSGQFLYYAVVLIWLATNGHHQLLSGIVRSFNAVPVQQAAMTTGLTTHIIEVFTELFTAALRIGLPFLVPLFLATVTMGILARAMPQLNLLIVGIPVKILVGFVILSVTLPALVSGFVTVTESLNDELVRTLLLLR